MCIVAASPHLLCNPLYKVRHRDKKDVAEYDNLASYWCWCERTLQKFADNRFDMQSYDVQESCRVHYQEGEVRVE